MQKIKIFCLYFLTIALFIGVVILGVLFYLKNNEALELNAKTIELNTTIGNLQQTVESAKKQVVTLELNGVIFTYPQDWKPKEQIKFESVSSSALSSYTVDFVKGDNLLSVSQLIGPTEFQPKGAKNGEVTYVKVNDAYSRIRKSASEDWLYVQNYPCNGNNDKTPLTSTYDFCYITSIGAQLGHGTVVTLSSGAGDDILKEADQIVVSAFGK